MMDKKDFWKDKKNAEDINKKQLEKQLKPIENDKNNANAKIFLKSGFLNKLDLKAKEKKWWNLRAW